MASSATEGLPAQAAAAPAAAGPPAGLLVPAAAAGDGDGGPLRTGSASVLLKPLAFLLHVKEEAPVLDLATGREVGKIQVRLLIEGLAELGAGNRTGTASDLDAKGLAAEDGWTGPDFETDEFAGKSLRVRIETAELAGSSFQRGSGLELRYTFGFPTGPQPPRTIVAKASQARNSAVNLELSSSELFQAPFSKELQDWLAVEALDLEFWSTPVPTTPSSPAAKPVIISAPADAELKGKFATLEAERDKLRQEVEQLKTARAEDAKKAEDKSKTCVIL